MSFRPYCIQCERLVDRCEHIARAEELRKQIDEEAQLECDPEYFSNELERLWLIVYAEDLAERKGEPFHPLSRDEYQATVVGVECMEAAIAFIEWQCRLRGIFKPSEAKDTPEAVLGEIVMDKFHKLAALGQEPIRWGRVAHDMKWRKHGPNLVKRTVEGLVAMGELEYGRTDSDSKKVIMDRNSMEGKRCPLIVWVKWEK